MACFASSNGEVLSARIPRLLGTQYITCPIIGFRFGTLASELLFARGYAACSQGFSTPFFSLAIILRQSHESWHEDPHKPNTVVMPCLHYSNDPWMGESPEHWEVALGGNLAASRILFP
ncbi:hypothetical protein BOTCAL_0077g00130 [Botryotinia calthae]|uniref:Uncharacterized protein n=1 Tax=Botryotinia calthae TaxID=38488 RepID=A0A4Y8D8G4_9HELO|nr:hypothetical protein BOTCAL_0077g00130 [Botryotinia calthae]